MKKMIGAVFGLAVLAASSAAFACEDAGYVPAQRVYVEPPPGAYTPVAVAYWGRDDWRAREWREREWRRHEWREHEWREHEWREHEWRERHGWGY